MSDPLIKIKDLNAFYGDVQILWDASLEVYPGEIVSIIGPNGAGKSTLMRSIMGLVRINGNDQEPVIHYTGHVLDSLNPEEIVRYGICLVPEGAPVFPEMTCEDNLKIGAYRSRDKYRESQLLDRVLDLFPELKDRLRQKARTLSGGERQMLAIGRALMADPKFLLLDEPSLGLHPRMVSRIFKNIEKINQRGLPILMVEQKVTFVLKISHRAYVLENGRLVMSGPGNELLGNDHVRKTYLSV